MGMKKWCAGRKKKPAGQQGTTATKIQQQQEQQEVPIQGKHVMGKGQKTEVQKQAVDSSNWITPLRIGRSTSIQSQQLVQSNTYQALGKPGDDSMIKVTLGNGGGNHTSY